MPILGDWAVKYGAYAEQLGVPANDLYRALVDTAENTVRFLLYINTYIELPMLNEKPIATRLVPR